MPDAEQKPSQTKAKEHDPRNGDARPKADEDPVGKVYDSRLIKRLGQYLRPYWLQATISSISISLKSMSDVAGPYLASYARESAWREDNRRVSNGDQTQHTVALALSCGPSPDFCGYWQRHKA